MSRQWFARILIGLVILSNLECAILFIVHPEKSAPGYELSGVTGNFAIQGMGILFLMWSVPYIFALIHPLKYRVSLIQAGIMQTIGLAGESLLLAALPAGHPVLFSSIVRFILFDAGGWILLILAYFISRETR